MTALSGPRRSLGSLRFRAREAARAFWYRLPLPASRRYVRQLWDAQAEMIHATWGEDDHDFETIGRLITEYGVQSVLDVGCGSGRLFGLYQARGVTRVLGVDISEKALALAAQRHPNIETRVAPVEELPIEELRFDLAICNRVLQHVPPLAINRVVARLARTAHRVYVNELSVTDGERENFYMVRHDYVALFANEGCGLVEEGLIGLQRYQVFAGTSGSATP
jgi:SAM-dependent methyltransferase